MALNGIRERRHRLPDEYYRGIRTVAFTAVLYDRVRLFRLEPVVRVMEQLLLEATSHWGGEIVVYLFMPDHLHTLLASTTEQGDVLAAMKRFKQRSGLWLARHHRPVRWQKDFYDHILRFDEDVIRHVRYILGNPVRADMVKEWKEYPYRGSTVFDIDGWDSI